MSWIIENRMELIAIGVFLIVLIFIAIFSKNFRKKLASIGKYIWNDMEVKRILSIVTLAFQSVLRLVSSPFYLLGWVIENYSSHLKFHFAIRKQLSEKTDHQRSVAAEKRARSLFIENIIEAATNSNSVLSGRHTKKIKFACIGILEIISFITTAIGLMIIASDISPLVAIGLSAVIQLLATVISISAGKRNIIILIVCLIVSMGSGYVCYLNAVFPYDTYIETQYNDYKSSYDDAWGFAVETLSPYAFSDGAINLAFNNVYQTIRNIKTAYAAGSSDEERQERIDGLYEEKEMMESTNRHIIPGTITGYSPIIYDPNTGIRIGGGSPIYSPNQPNPVYQDIIVQIGLLEDSRGVSAEKRDRINNAVSGIEEDLKAMESDGESGEKRAIAIMATLKSLNKDDGHETVLRDLNAAYFSLSQQLTLVTAQVNKLISEESIGMNPVGENSLSDIKSGFEIYQSLNELRLLEFQEIRAINDGSASVFDWLFDSFSKIIDSDFVANSVKLKKEASKETEFKHNALLAQVNQNPILSTNAELMERIGFVESLQVDQNAIVVEAAGNDESVIEDTRESLTLIQAKSNLEYQDALSRAIDKLLSPEDKRSEVYSRLFYAFLADGLVLLIGFSLRREKTSIYRVKNRRELVNEEPRLIKEALYNLSATTREGQSFTPYSVGNLIWYLSDFFSHFSVESYMYDPKLNLMFSMVSKDSTVLDEEYKELICLLHALNFIKPLAKEQYDFFTQYKRNKAISGNTATNVVSPIVQSVANNEKYYLMTSGCSLYFSEIANDLFEHIENAQIRDELIEKAKKDGLIESVTEGEPENEFSK